VKLSLRLAIQGFWALIGAMSVWLLTQMIWRIFSHPPSLAGWVLFPFMAFLLTALVFAAWSALFRFSPAVVKPCVFIITLVLLDAALKAHRTYLQPMVESDIHRTAGSLMPFVALLGLFLVVVATIKFYRITSALIIRMLFPEILPFSTRIY
jgi:hypothetical protein